MNSHCLHEAICTLPYASRSTTPAGLLWLSQCTPECQRVHHQNSGHDTAVVENVAVRREPLPKMAGVYFITPSDASVARLVEDFKDSPLYASAHVFFSSPAPQTVLAAIRSCPGLTSRLRSLKEVR